MSHETVVTKQVPLSKIVLKEEDQTNSLLKGVEGLAKIAGYVWDTGALEWVRGEQSSGSSASDPTTVKTVLLDQASATVLYIGKADPGTATSAASWRISRLTASGSSTALEWAGSDESYTKMWDNRAALVYA